MTMTKTRNSTSQKKKIEVLDKYGNHSSYITPNNAAFSVRREKAIWVDGRTIQILYHHSDEKMFRLEVFKRDKYVCQYCERQMHEGHELLTTDHVVPQRLGGSILPKNMVCSCRTCNEQKGHRTFKEYLLHLSALLYWRSLSYNALEGKGEHEETNIEVKSETRAP